MNGLSHWDGLNHFRPDSTVDHWGDPHNMDRSILVEIDKLREWLNCPLIVTSAWRGHGGADEGKLWHAAGRAVDVVAPTFEGHLLDLFFAATRFGFTGIGVYKDWEYKGKLTGGLHLDTRYDVDHKALWFCYKDVRGIQRYVALSHQALKGFGVV